MGEANQFLDPLPKVDSDLVRFRSIGINAKQAYLIL